MYPVHSSYDENGDVERYNVFSARVLIRYAYSEKLYLNDIVQKKETSTPLE